MRVSVIACRASRCFAVLCIAGAHSAFAADAIARTHSADVHPGWLLLGAIGIVVAKVRRSRKRVF
jgi:hypothetical protein